MSAKTELPLRPCVGVMLLNADGLVWIGRRASSKTIQEDEPGAWQMPQGGIDEGEDARAAALRELEEETSVPASAVEVIGETDGWLAYELPAELMGIALKGKYRGQKQKWFAARYLGSDADIDLVAAADKEFDTWRWAEMRELPELIVAFKRPVYEEVCKAFAHLAGTKA